MISPSLSIRACSAAISASGIFAGSSPIGRGAGSRWCSRRRASDRQCERTGSSGTAAWGPRCVRSSPGAAASQIRRPRAGRRQLVARRGKVCATVQNDIRRPRSYQLRCGKRSAFKPNSSFAEGRAFFFLIAGRCQTRRRKSGSRLAERQEKTAAPKPAAAGNPAIRRWRSPSSIRTAAKAGAARKMTPKSLSRRETLAIPVWRSRSSVRKGPPISCSQYMRNSEAKVCNICKHCLAAPSICSRRRGPLARGRRGKGADEGG